MGDPEIKPLGTFEYLPALRIAYPKECARCGQRDGSCVYKIASLVKHVPAGNPFSGVDSSQSKTVPRSDARYLKAEVPICPECEQEVNRAKSDFDHYAGRRMRIVFGVCIIVSIGFFFLELSIEDSMNLELLLGLGLAGGILLWLLVGYGLEKILERKDNLQFVKFDRQGGLKFRNREYQKKFDEMQSAR